MKSHGSNGGNGSVSSCSLFVSCWFLSACFSFFFFLPFIPILSHFSTFTRLFVILCDSLVSFVSHNNHTRPIHLSSDTLPALYFARPGVKRTPTLTPNKQTNKQTTAHANITHAHTQQSRPHRTNAHLLKSRYTWG